MEPGGLANGQNILTVTKVKHTHADLTLTTIRTSLGGFAAVDHDGGGGVLRLTLPCMSWTSGSGWRPSLVGMAKAQCSANFVGEG
jgi:hypothetical protein